MIKTNNNKYNLTKIVDVEYTKEVKPVMDIEVSHPNHQFFITSLNGATGISHNSALISLSNLSDERMRDCKSGDWWNQSPNLSFANNSVVYTEKPDIGIFMKEWLSLYMSKSGERGIFNRYGTKKRLKEEGVRNHEHEFGVNPCLTGDTLVSVADGRGMVSLKQLSEEESDVPVYCLNQDGDVVISNMVNPRITGYNVPVYEVELEQGHTIRTTGNHQFYIHLRGYVPVNEINVGDSILIKTRLQEKLTPDANNFYWRFNCNGKKFREHQLIAKYKFNPQSNDYVTHHIDGDSSNNKWDNITICSIDEHNKIHGFYDTKGFKNAAVNPVSNNSLLQHFINLTFRLQRQITNYDWKRYAKFNDLPLKIRSFRLLGNFKYLVKWSAQYLGIPYHNDIDPRTIRKYYKALDEGYDCELIDNKIVYHKVCEFSQEKFDTCVKEQMIKNEHALSYYHQMKDKFNFDVDDTVVDYNHKITSIRFVGYEDVYNGTVENYHNFFVGGWEEQINNKKKHVFINNLQCGEVVLRPRELCNLSTTILRPQDTLADIKEKVSIATFLGTIQSDLTTFRFLSKEWKKNCEEEHLLGVSLSGIMDHPFLSRQQEKCDGFDQSLPDTLMHLRDFIRDENIKYAEMINISPSVSYTAIKPEGNSSSLNNTSPGIHPRFSPYYIRSIRFDNHDPLAKMLKDQGVKNEPDLMKPETTTVFYFPIKSPENAIFVKNVTALEQLELYKIYKQCYTTHTVSITVYVKEHEWLDVGAWVYKHFDIVSGLTFLPNLEHTYSQLPYDEVTEEEYNIALQQFPNIDWKKLKDFEQEDNTTGGQEYACMGGSCMLD